MIAAGTLLRGTISSKNKQTTFLASGKRSKTYLLKEVVHRRGRGVAVKNEAVAVGLSTKHAWGVPSMHESAGRPQARDKKSTHVKKKPHSAARPLQRTAHARTAHTHTAELCGAATFILLDIFKVLIPTRRRKKRAQSARIHSTCSSRLTSGRSMASMWAVATSRTSTTEYGLNPVSQTTFIIIIIINFMHSLLNQHPMGVGTP